MKFKKVFDERIYRNFLGRSQLSKTNYEILYKHYTDFGIYEGHTVHNNSRFDYFNFNDDSSVLEIGPAWAPICNHSKPNIYSIDICSQEELIKKAKADKNIKNSQIKNIPKTDFLLSANDFSITKSVKNKKFDYIISSHNFEHFPNLIKYLNDYSSILNDNGYIVAFIPDCRFEFDNLRKKTSLADILSDYYNKRTKPSFKQALDMRILACDNNAHKHWTNHINSLYNSKLLDLKPRDDSILNKYANIEYTKEYIDNLYKESQETYIDTHNYTFTSKTFETYINTLFKLKYINLKIHRMYHTLRYKNEFCVVLKKQ